MTAHAPTQPWSSVVDGTAVGPSTTVTCSNGQTVTMTALWSDTDGVVVDLDGPDDAIPAGDLAHLARAMVALGDTAPPKEMTA